MMMSTPMSALPDGDRFSTGKKDVAPEQPQVCAPEEPTVAAEPMEVDGGLALTVVPRDTGREIRLIQGAIARVEWRLKSIATREKNRCDRVDKLDREIEESKRQVVHKTKERCHLSSLTRKNDTTKRALEEDLELKRSELALLQQEHLLR